MKKNIEWLKAEVEKQDIVMDKGYIYTNDLIYLINQLDEAEVLSQELPVIPKYVAEYINLVKIDIPLMKVLGVANRRNELPEWKKEYDWISANDEMFARAWLNGYTVEAEPLYYAMVKGHELLDTDRFYWIYDKYEESVFLSKLYSLHGNFLTEMSKSQWNELGINDSNADFVRVEENE